jgi:hypothetical protein
MTDLGFKRPPWVQDTSDPVWLTADQVRTKMEKWCYGKMWFSANMCGACAVCSHVLARVLRRSGYQAELVVGMFDDEDHCWVVQDRNIIDITATQFGLPRIHIVKPNGKTYSMYEPTARGKAAHRLLRRSWPKESRPFKKLESTINGLARSVKEG